MERWASRHSHIDFFIMENGFITIHRRLLKWEWYNKPEMVSLFLTLLLLANNEKNRWQGHEINRGQLITGLHSLSKTTGISIQTIKTCLARLKSTGEITSKSTNKFRIITIVKYNDYQDKEKKSTGRLTSKLTNNQQTTNKQLTTNNNNNNIYNNIYNNNNNNNILQPAVAEEYSFQNQLNKMFKDKDRRMSIIAYYWTIKGFNFNNGNKYSSALKRELRPAKDLIGYTNEEIKKTCQWLKENSSIDFTLETVLKYINEVKIMSI